MNRAYPAPEADQMPVQAVDTLIVGAGPSGLAAAWRLAEAGMRPVIIEKSPYFGGLMRSIGHGPFIVDLGRKELYSRIPEVDRLWQDLLGADYRDYVHRVGSLHDGRIIEMSGRFRGIMRGMPLSSFLLGAGDLGRCWLASAFRRPVNYQQYWYQRAGARFARMLAQGYWEKFRGTRWADMPVPSVHADGQAVRSHSLGAIAHGVMLAARGSASSQPRWRHPARGTGQLCGMLVKRLRKAGVEIRFGAELAGMVGGQGRVTDMFVRSPAGMIRYQPRNLVSSLQVEDLFACLNGAGAGMGGGAGKPIVRRNIILVYLFLDEPPHFPHAWLEVNDTALHVGRITNYAAFGGDMVPPGKTALCVEYFLDADMPDRADPDWARLAVAECGGCGLIDPARLIDDMVLRLDRCNAAASWREAQEEQRLRMFGEIRPYANLYHVYRPGTDWATFAGLMAAEAIITGSRAAFDRRADPTRSYAAAGNGEEGGSGGT